MAVISEEDGTFLRAVRDGNFSQVVSMLDKGQSVDTVNFNGMGALHLAAKEGHVDVLMELLNRGANPEAKTQKLNTPLHVAALARNAATTKVLLDRGADTNAISKTGFTPLYLAAQENGADIVDMLLKAGADQRIHTVDGFSPLAVAVQQENSETISVLLPNWRRTAQDYAVHLLEAVGENCQDVLRHAADGDIIGVRRAVQTGADVNAALRDGLTPLHMAVVMGNLQMVRELINHGALPNTTSEKLSTPLGTACHICRRDIIQALLDAGAEPNIKTRPCDPLMPLHITCNYGDIVATQMLLEHRADVTTVGKWMSMNPRVAFDSQHSEIVSLCLRWALKLCPEQHTTTASLHQYINPPETPDEPDRDPAATCLVMMCPLFRSRPKQVDAIVSSVLESVPQAFLCANAPDVVFQITIFKATEEGNTELAQACISESVSCIEVTSPCGLTPLHVASLHGHTEVVSLLLQHKANINAATDKGLTPAILAAYANQTPVLDILIDSGASLSLHMQNGLTPLGMAIAKQNLPAAETILRRQPLALPCNILAILSTQSEETLPALNKVMGAVEWACRSNPLSSGAPRKKGKQACVLA